MMEFRLLDSRIVSVPKTLAVFRQWTGAPITDDYGGKALLDYAGEPLFAELVILRELISAGWCGVWVDTYRRRTRVGMTEDAPLPREQRAVLDRVAVVASTSSGCFDVFAWSDDGVVFVEAKRAGHDRIRPSQVRWLSAALDVGLPLDAFLVVEWSLSQPHV